MQFPWYCALLLSGWTDGAVGSQYSNEQWMVESRNTDTSGTWKTEGKREKCKQANFRGSDAYIAFPRCKGSPLLCPCIGGSLSFIYQHGNPHICKMLFIAFVVGGILVVRCPQLYITPIPLMLSNPWYPEQQNWKGWVLALFPLELLMFLQYYPPNLQEMHMSISGFLDTNIKAKPYCYSGLPGPICPLSRMNSSLRVKSVLFFVWLISDKNGISIKRRMGWLI